MKKTHFVFLLASLFVLPAFLSADTVVEEIIVRVNNSIITSSDYARSKEQLKDETVEASVGGGMVTVVVGGDLTVREIRIDRDAVDPDDVELLQDMVLAAVNEGLRAAQELATSKLGGLTGGLGDLGLPGLGA